MRCADRRVGGLPFLLYAKDSRHIIQKSSELSIKSQNLLIGDLLWIAHCEYLPCNVSDFSTDLGQANTLEVVAGCRGLRLWATEVRGLNLKILICNVSRLFDLHVSWLNIVCPLVWAS